MPLDELKPTDALRVIDLVEEAGLDVAPWAFTQDGTPVERPAANPAYCYEWCFVENSQRIVLCLWFDHLEEHNGDVLSRRNIRDLRRRVEAAPHLKGAAKSAAVKRAMRVDSAVQLAFRTGLDVRIIILDGDRRDLDDVARTDPSHVERRLLDDSPWSIREYDWNTGAAVMARKEPLRWQP